MGFHFSPARYHRLLQVVKIFEEDDGSSPDMVCPWNQADFEGWLSLLSWKVCFLLFKNVMSYLIVLLWLVSCLCTDHRAIVLENCHGNILIFFMMACFILIS